MTDSKKYETSASIPQPIRAEAIKRFNPSNVVPKSKRARSQRYLYGGMLYPSHVTSIKNNKSLERDGE